MSGALVNKALLAAAIAGLFLPTCSHAGFIGGPSPLPDPTTGWNVSGIGLIAAVNTKLLGFNFQNCDNADMVVLTDNQGNILHSLATPAGYGAQGYQANVGWSLQAGQRYWLLQTTPGNGKYAPNTSGHVFDGDLDFIQTGTFGTTVQDAVIHADAWQSAPFWSSFTAINSLAPAVPEPATLALVGAGLAGALRRRRR